nr:unnamed protein product [Callosobruchus chinensis]
MEDNFSMCGICWQLLPKTEINKNRPFDVLSTENVIKISEALYYVAPEGSLRIFEQMELCNSCIENLRSAYKFKYDCLTAEKAISKYLQENQSSENTKKNHSLDENSDVTLLPKPPESEDTPSESNENGDIAQNIKDASVKNGNQPMVPEKTLSKPAETTGQHKTVEEEEDLVIEVTNNSLIQDISMNSGDTDVQSGQTCELEPVKLVSEERNSTPEQANLIEPPKLKLFKKPSLLKDKLAQHLGATRTTIGKGLNVDECSQSEENITPKQRNVIEPSKNLISKTIIGLSSTNTKDSVVFTANISNNANKTRNVTKTKVTKAEEIQIPGQKNAIAPPGLFSKTTNLSNDTKYQSTNIEKEPDVSKSKITSKNEKALQGEVVPIKQENIAEPSELTFCDTTGLFKNKQNQYFNEEGKMIDPNDLEQEVQKALEKVNSIFTEPIINSEPVQPIVNNKPVEAPSVVPPKPMVANAGIFTPVTVTEDNGVFSITAVGDAVKNSFIALDNPFMMDDRIDIKQEPLEWNDFDSIGTDDDTISAPETMMQNSEFGGTDEYVDIPEFVVVNKKGADVEQNLNKMQPAVLEKKLFGGKARKRIYKKLKMVAAYEEITPEPKVQKVYSTYPIRKQHPSYYSNEYLASFFAKNGDYTYDHDYIWALQHGEHMLDTHRSTTRCTVCDVDMGSSFALNVHVERHTKWCQHCSKSVTYSATQAHELNHLAKEQMINPRPRGPEPIRSPALPPSNSTKDEVADTSQRLTSEAGMEKLFYKTDESEDSNDDVQVDTSYNPTPPKRQLRRKSRQKSDPPPPAVEPSGRLLRSHIKKSQEVKEGVH